MRSVYLLRHGAHGDVGHRLTGRAPDGGLTAAGREQVRAACDHLALAPPSAIFASPRRRTEETAQIVADRFHLPVLLVNALDEIDFGHWTGQSFHDLDRHPAWHEWNARRASGCCPGGESMQAAQARAVAFAFEAAARHGRPPLLVTHCDIIRALVCWSERRSLDDIHAIACEPASLSHIDLSAADRQVAA